MPVVRWLDFSCSPKTCVGEVNRGRPQILLISHNYFAGMAPLEER